MSDATLKTMATLSFNDVTVVVIYADECDEFRVYPKGLKPAAQDRATYFTDCPIDALGTARAMVRERCGMKAEPVANIKPAMASRIRKAERAMV